MVLNLEHSDIKNGFRRPDGATAITCNTPCKDAAEVEPLVFLALEIQSAKVAIEQAHLS